MTNIGRLLLAVLVTSALPFTSKADSICGPGRHLASDAFACLDGDTVRSVPSPSADWSNLGAGLLLGSSALSIVEELASQTEPTDNVGEALPDDQGHGTRSRNLNRQAIVIQPQGRYAQA